MPKPSLKVKSDHIYATGRRKTATARVYLQQGSGQVFVNRKPLNDVYAEHLDWHQKVMQPFALLGQAGEFDVIAFTKGGGNTGQAEALRLGISRALDAWECRVLKVDPRNEEHADVERPWHRELRQAGYLTRDARKVYRKLVGLVKSRKAKQFSKR